MRTTASIWSIVIDSRLEASGGDTIFEIGANGKFAVSNLILVCFIKTKNSKNEIGKHDNTFIKMRARAIVMPTLDVADFK
jgi:hypothetical protein